jgi:hypothetical protein
MARVNPYEHAAWEAERVVREHGISRLPVDPFAIANRNRIEVVQKPASDRGVSGMLIRLGDQFAIAYASHIDSTGFRRFSVSHELGHYFLPGHIDAVFADGETHTSRAGFISQDRYEREADYFAATLLMPNALFSAALRRAGEGLKAVENLAAACETSLPATAIRYAQCSRDATAIAVSTAGRIDYCFMSAPLADLEGIGWIRKNQPLPRASVTWEFNRNPERIRRADRTAGETPFQDWFGGPYRIQVTEEVIGLGSYGRTLTVLGGIELPDEEDSDEALEESWTPRFRRR